MESTLTSRLFNWLPAQGSVTWRERLVCCAGALVGILLTGLASGLVLGWTAQAAWLIAPMGASAVLLFAVPASPLAQPWSIIGGNLVAATVGVTCAQLPIPVVLAAALAIFFAIGGMFGLRCIHPPSGAVALTAVLGGPAIHAAGYGFIVTPIGLNTLLLLATALAWNNLLGRRYPHRQQLKVEHPHRTADAVPTRRLGFRHEDLQAALKDYGHVLDVSEDDLDRLFRQTEMHAFRRRFADTRCHQIMARDILSVEFATELDEAWRLMAEHRMQALPVIDRTRRIIGIVTRSDFLLHADLPDHRSIGRRLRAFLLRTPSTHSDKQEVVGQIMTAPVKTALESTPIVELVPLMADVGLHHVPVVDARGRLVGMVTQTDLVGALYETSLGRLASIPGDGQVLAEVLR